jgi:hypothetical protein
VGNLTALVVKNANSGDAGILEILDGRHKRCSAHAPVGYLDRLSL